MPTLQHWRSQLSGSSCLYLGILCNATFSWQRRWWNYPGGRKKKCDKEENTDVHSLSYSVIQSQKQSCLAMNREEQWRATVYLYILIPCFCANRARSTCTWLQLSFLEWNKSLASKTSQSRTIQLNRRCDWALDKVIEDHWPGRILIERRQICWDLAQAKCPNQNLGSCRGETAERTFKKTFEDLKLFRLHGQPPKFKGSTVNTCQYCISLKPGRKKTWKEE